MRVGASLMLVAATDICSFSLGLRSQQKNLYGVIILILNGFFLSPLLGAHQSVIRTKYGALAAHSVRSSTAPAQ